MSGIWKWSMWGFFQNSDLENRSGKYYKFVYFQRFDEFFPQFQFFLSNQKFIYFQRFDEFFPSVSIFPVKKSNQKIVYYKRFDEFFHCISISEKTHGRHAFLDFQKATNIDFLFNLPLFEVLYISSLSGVGLAPWFMTGRTEVTPRS